MGTIILDDVTQLNTIKISELAELTDIGESDILPMVESGTTKKITKANFYHDAVNTTSRIVYVSKSGNDSNPGTIHDPFLTIQAAIDYAYGEYGVITDFTNTVVIKIAPGIYTEQIHSYGGYFLSGEMTGWYTSIGSTPPTIFNTGADEAHWPLRSDDGDVIQMIGITIKTDVDGVIGRVNRGFYINCYLERGHFIEQSETGTSSYPSFKGCFSRGNTYGGFNLAGTNLNNGGWMPLNDCNLRGNPSFSSTHTDNPVIAFTNVFIKGHIEVSGDWNFYTAMAGCNSWGKAVRHEFNTTGKVKIYGGSCVNGIHFTSAPSELEISGLAFSSLEDNKIPDGEADITADVDVTANVFIVNIPHNGISGKIKTPGSKKHVGSYIADAYFSLQDAIDSIPTAGEGIVELSENLIDLTELTITGAKNITIDGKRAWSIAFTSDIVELGPNQILTLSKIKTISGDLIEINGNGAELHLHDCNHDSEFSVLLTSGVGANIHINSTNYVAPTGLSPLQINSADPETMIEYSRIVGAIGQPAIEFTVVADDKLKSKFSSFIHGDGGGNSPIQTTAAASDIAIYSCGLNAAWPPADFTNTIGSAGNITDSNIDF